MRNEECNTNKDRANKDRTEVSVLEDVNIVAFLTTKGFNAVPFIKDKESRSNRRDARVAWKIEGDTSEAIEEYYGNKEVDVYRFVKALKDVRAEMYNMKQTNK